MPYRSLLTAPLLLGLLLPAQPSLAASPACPLPMAALDLPAVVAQALCRNPATHTAWLNVAAQQARVKSAQSAYYPTLDASATQSHSFGDAGSAERSSAQLSANWLLYDFGARAANRHQAERLLSVLQASQEATAQAVIQQAVDAYYAWYAADEALLAAQASEEAARETLRAAEIRQRVGAGTLADVLQARTALSQATLTVIQNDGSREIGRGTVAQALGLPSPSAITLTPPPATLPADLAPPAFAELAAALVERRPDLRAQKLNVEAAKAARASIDAQDRPSISAFANDGLSHADTQSGQTGSGKVESGTVGLSISVPLFAGGRYRAQEAVAERQIELAETEYERQSISASNELWAAWQGVRTSAATVGASHDLVASASEAHRAALARYRAGLGSLIEVLTAQSTLADARQREATARFNWQRARVSLIKASGVLNSAVLNAATEPSAETEPSADMKSPSEMEPSSVMEQVQ